METIKIKTKDDNVFTIDKKVGFRSILIKNMYADLDVTDDVILPINSIDDKTFTKIIEFCNHYKDDNSEVKDFDPKDLTEWDQEFTDIPIAELKELVIAANFLDIKDLVNVCCKTYANHLKGKSVQECREILEIPEPVSEVAEQEHETV